ncbi:MAG: hypothetical protein IT581_12885 [Verrucomicrobiales bacterium]|nr:hypothetical protein [Verrucomicrobiales bacterium]
MSLRHSHPTRFAAVVACCGLAVTLVFRCPAAPLAYTNGDLLACFRADGGAADLVVKLGGVAEFDGLPVGTRLALNNLSSSQLSAAFPTLNGIAWSVLGVARGNTNLPQYALHTLWLTSPHLTAETLGPVWKRQGPYTQGPIGSQIEIIGAGAATYSSQQPAGPNNTATGVIIDANDPNAYTTLMSTAGNLAGTFQGNVEAATASDFVSASTPSRALLYQLAPATGSALNSAGRILGTLEFAPDGTLSFTAGPPPVRIADLRLDGDTVVIGFASYSSFAYRLRSTNAEGLNRPTSQWPTDGEPLTGDGSFITLRAPRTSTAQFYAIEVLR